MAGGSRAACPEYGKTVKLSPSQRLLRLGAILFVALTVCAHSFSGRGEAAYLVALAVGGVAYLLAIRELLAAPRFSKRVVLFGLGLAALWHIEFLVRPPGIDDDIHRYVWDGRVQRLGYNPYLVVPNDPALAGLHTSETRTLNNPDVPSPYPPGAQLFFRGVMAIHESAFALKIAFEICAVAIVLLLFDLLRSTEQEAHWILAYAWHPLLATEVAGSGHIDILGVLLLVMSAAALSRRWRGAAAVAFGLSIAVKFLPIILLPLYWKRVRVRDAALAVVIIGLLYFPFLNHGHIPLGSLGTYVQRFRFNDPIFGLLERVAAPQIVAGVAVLIGIVTATLMKSKRAETFSDEFAWPTAASLLCAPVVYPWYLLWVLPFVRSTATVPIMVWTVSIIPTYYVWRMRELGLPWVVPNWILLLEYGSVAIASLILSWQRFGRAEAPGRPAG